ncbi:MAG: hypothetical protein B7X95_09330 [Methylophilaceae bacterium 17-44-8]|jgi:hypothetical protein|nr:MAG: hypothetical protein B7Y48_01305 [Methylophilales bacterium 28-44-11]OYZ11900.1 MAG: hypothetical protein B7Y32_00065 [Methylophilales bacterium 16-45-7]OZA04684.1 MAG: hypothetical protein B7X95_09330 [Methylophilaceae bacterium 17-44-8]
MDNKYGLGSTKVATEHQAIQEKSDTADQVVCKFCKSTRLVLSPTMHDHRCDACGEWQQDVPQGYSSGRSSDY